MGFLAVLLSEIFPSQKSVRARRFGGLWSIGSRISLGASVHCGFEYPNST
jgi:hypothetical protein